MELPQSLHSQLYLVAVDRKRHRLDDSSRLCGMALRAAMLTDLYLTGHIEDRAGVPAKSSSVAPPEDPLLRVVLDRIGTRATRDWCGWIAGDRDAAKAVRNQLEAVGWLTVPPRTLGFLPTGRRMLHDDDAVSGLAERVTLALHNALAGLPADPRPLAVGLLGVLGQIPEVLSLDDAKRHRRQLRDMTLAAIEPILGLHQAIEARHTNVRADMAGSALWTP